LYIFLLSIDSWSSGSARKTEAGLQCSNKIHRRLLRLAGESCETSDGPVWYVPPGSGAPDFGGYFGASFVHLWRLVSPFLVYAPARSGRYVYQLVELLGWVIDPTSFGGSAPLQGSSPSGYLGILILEASDSLRSDDEMADCHRFLPGRSAYTEHVGVSVQHKTATKICSSPERWSGSSSALRPPAVRKTGRNLQEPSCNFFFFEGCSCKIWAVTTISFM